MRWRGWRLPGILTQESHDPPVQLFHNFLLKLPSREKWQTSWQIDENASECSSKHLQFFSVFILWRSWTFKEDLWHIWTLKNFEITSVEPPKHLGRTSEKPRKNLERECTQKVIEELITFDHLFITFRHRKKCLIQIRWVTIHDLKFMPFMGWAQKLVET